MHMQYAVLYIHVHVMCIRILYMYMYMLFCFCQSAADVTGRLQFRPLCARFWHISGPEDGDCHRTCPAPSQTAVWRKGEGTCIIIHVRVYGYALCVYMYMCMYIVCSLPCVCPPICALGSYPGTARERGVGHEGQAVPQRGGGTCLGPHCVCQAQPLPRGQTEVHCATACIMACSAIWN